MLCAMRRWVGVSRCPSNSACSRVAGLSVTPMTCSPSRGPSREATGPAASAVAPDGRRGGDGVRAILFSRSPPCIRPYIRGGDPPGGPTPDTGAVPSAAGTAAP
ncbi:hypothetical protein GCM10010238_19720 [Streptomyces griseoviridis]|uniref:Uncharacterized protein n=1 Tax=Streptomyces griseoviridis TaxID=45398 RepID=A0A918LC54_STRGD|nr:hypothetical protein GCM10010238_19720 [Streptomyces niveoruber]